VKRKGKGRRREAEEEIGREDGSKERDEAM
jgi:hypothetical protein